MLQYSSTRGTEMRSLKYIKSGLLIIICATALTTSNICTEKVVAEPIAATVQQQYSVKQDTIRPLDIVKSPKTYLGQKVTMIARFDKFSTLGLDYKSAYKSSDDYISFLIKRDDTIYDIPLSEMKLFLKRDLAEKFIDLKVNDEIQIDGTVFSDALSDAWIDVESITIIKKAPKEDGVK